MRFIVMHKVDASMEAGGPPSPKIIKNMATILGDNEVDVREVNPTSAAK